MTQEQERLEKLFRSEGSIPTASDNFERRIIDAASLREQRTRGSFLAWLTPLFKEFYLPQPAYALASVLVLGVIAGVSLPELPDVTSAADETASLQLFLDDEETLL